MHIHIQAINLKVIYKYSKKILLGTLLFGIPLAFFFYFFLREPPKAFLPKLGPKAVETVECDGERVIDTVYHTIPGFAFVNQRGDTVRRGDLEGHIFVSDFFFTNCPGFCPKLTNQMKRVQERFSGKAFLKLVSFSVDPVRDSVAALSSYAGKYGVNADMWHLLTGDKEKIYTLAQQGFLVSAVEGDEGPEDIIHSERFILVDKEGIIRGFYTGTDSADVNRLMRDIEVLSYEDEIKREIDKRRIEYKPRGDG